MKSTFRVPAIISLAYASIVIFSGIFILEGDWPFGGVRRMWGHFLVDDAAGPALTVAVITVFLAIASRVIRKKLNIIPPLIIFALLVFLWLKYNQYVHIAR